MKQIWRKIDGASNYRVSNKGRVKVLKHKNIIDRIDRGKLVHQQYYRKGQILNPQCDNMGYLHYRLKMDDGKMKLFKAHRLVAMYFIDNFNPQLHIDHIDGNKQNNNINNLQLLTIKENLQKKYNQDPKYNYKCLNTNQIFTSFKCFCKRNNLQHSKYYFWKSLNNNQTYKNTNFKFIRIKK